MSAAAVIERAKPELPAELVGRPAAEILLGYQSRLLASTAIHQVVVCEKSRRIGVTWGIGADAVLTSAADRSAGGMDTLYIGYNLDMAREFIDVCGMWARAFSLAAGDVGEFLFKDGPDRDIQAFRIAFASGFEIVALASRPRSLRGRQGYVIVDEAAFHDDLEELLKAAMALLIWGGKVLVISTHDGAENPFAELIADIRAGRKPYHPVRITFDDALQDGLYKRVCLKAHKPWSAEGEAAWRASIYAFYGDAAEEELDVVPRAGGGVFLPSTLIESRMVDGIPIIRLALDDAFALKPDHERESWIRDWLEEHVAPVLATLTPDERHALGEDFGRSGDLTVLWVLAITRTMRRPTRLAIELRNVPFLQQEQILKFVCDALPNFCGAHLDARGNGQYLAERAQQKYGARATAVMISPEWYRDVMPKMKAGLEDGVLTLPRDDDVHGDLRALKMEKGVARIPDARAKDKSGQRHGDAAIAIAMAYAASLNPAPPIDHAASGQKRAALGAFEAAPPDQDAPMDFAGKGLLTGRWV